MDLEEPHRSRLLDLNRTTLRLWEWGDEAAPAVLCLHGAFDHGRMWDGVAPVIASWGYRVVAIDQRGHGDSGRLSSGNTWFAVALDNAVLARVLGPPVGVIGHSFGGGQAMYLAGVWPELVRWVVNLDGLGPPAAVFTEVDTATAAARGFDVITKLATRPPRSYSSLDEMVQRRREVNPRLPIEWIEHLVRHGARPTDDGWVWKADPTFSVGFPGGFSLGHLLAEHALVQAPMLALTGAEVDTWSDLQPDALAERLSHIPDVRHEVVAGAGHYVHIEQPEVVLDAIARFMKEIDG
jgi:pimeloyl-ACP methyl ester carboxylesterase